MEYLKLPENKTRPLPFYLAMEEFAARNLPGDELFFMWQVPPTVIFGRNQLIDNEVDVDYCRRNHIAVYRRKSGGGCVFADEGNIMMSYITRSDNVTTTFASYTHAVAALLQKLGLNASASTRNDVLVDGKKVSGNAFYHIPGRAIVHGTMLFTTNHSHMERAITPSGAKLRSKGVESVQSRITTLSEHLDMDIDTFKQFVANDLCGDNVVALTHDDELAIEALSQVYYAPSFIYGRNPRCNVERRARIEGVGELCVSMMLHHNIIHDLNVAGDFFLLGDVDRLASMLEGVPCDEASLEAALAPMELSQIIMNLNTKQFIQLLTGKQL